jgi:hypothetical protein
MKLFFKSMGILVDALKGNKMREINVNNRIIEVHENVEIAVSELKKMGYQILSVGMDSAFEPGMHVKKDEMIFRVEIKEASVLNRKMIVNILEDVRKNDDLICIVFPSKYVLIEPMKNHLQCCNEDGRREFFGVF